MASRYTFVYFQVLTAGGRNQYFKARHQAPAGEGSGAGKTASEMKEFGIKAVSEPAVRRRPGRF